MCSDVGSTISISGNVADTSRPSTSLSKARLFVIADSLAMFRQVVAPVADKCDALRGRCMSLRAIYFASKPLMAAEKTALRKLTSDSRILEKLGA